MISKQQLLSGKPFISERLGIQKGDIVCPNTLKCSSTT